MDKPVLATIHGTMLAPGVSKNNRQYTEAAIGRAVKRMKERLNDPEGLPIVMRTHHGAGDDSRQIVGRIVDVTQERNGSANYTAKLYNNDAGRNLAPLLAPDESGKSALRTTSIYGYWVGPVENVSSSDGSRVEVGEDLEVEAIDFTASPGVAKSQVHSVAFESYEHVDYSDKKKFVESAEATITMAPVVEVEPDDDKLEIYERSFTTKQRKSMAAAGQAMPGGRYPIANKSDLRNAIRAVGRGSGSHNDIRQHIIKRAKALGLSNLIPPNWSASGGMKESKPMPVGEHYIKVCIGDIDGDMIKLCADNLSPDIIKDAIKKAGKLADQMIGEDGTDLGQADEDDMIDDVDDIDWKIITCSPDGDDYDSVDYDGDGTPDDGTTGMPQETVNKIRRSIKAARESKKEESAMAETQAAKAAPGLSEEDLQKLGAIIGTAVKEAMAQNQAAKAAINAAAKPKAKNKKGQKADTSDNGPADTNESTQKPEALTESALVTKLAEERKRITDEIRENLIKEGAIPGRKGFRHVAENDENDLSKLTGDELWSRRGEIWGQVLPTHAPQPVA